jgi:predicted N-acyltransferase
MDKGAVLLDGWEAISAAEWDALAAPGHPGERPENPFLTHRFLRALESSGSTGPGTGWQAQPLVIRRGGALWAAAPLYVKGHSQGEYVFDHGWAEAFQRAGGRYYPKLQVAVPFTPVPGPRLLAEGPEGRAALLQTLADLTAGNGLSSAHITFCPEADLGPAQAAGYLHRTGLQYHWQNEGYRDYADFLDRLSSRKRKALRKERAAAQAFGGEVVALTGHDLRPEHWEAFWGFYQDTGARKWGAPYLTRAFFDALQEMMRDDVLLVLAYRGGRPIAGALNFIGRDALFGRYWGQAEEHPFLHFELCYHQAIDHAIAKGLSRVEAGAQGEHKIARGYLPVLTHSLHWIENPAFRQAVADYLDGERRAIEEERLELMQTGPFRQDGDKE